MVNRYLALIIVFGLGANSLLPLANPLKTTKNEQADPKEAEKTNEYKADVTKLLAETTNLARKGATSLMHGGESDKVRVSDDISKKEQDFLNKRAVITRKAIRNMFPDMNLKDDEIPTIAFVETGGGCRAMIETAGALAGAQEANLLETFTYMGGLSGSTWYINPLVAFGEQPVQYLDTLIKNMSEAPNGRDPILGIRIPSIDEIYTLARTIVMKYAYGQPINMIDVYGFLLANEFLANLPISKGRLTPDVLEKNKQNYSLSDLQDNLNRGQFPLPVSTALEVSESPITKWFEFTPYDIGSFDAGMRAYVPAWAFGRKYNNGSSTNTPPEISLGYVMGICGSAFALDAEELLGMVVKKLRGMLPDSSYAILDKALAALEKKLHDPKAREAHQKFMMQFDALAQLDTDRPDQVIRQITAGKLYNFTKGMPNQRMSGNQHLLLIDGGHDSQKLPFRDGWGIVNLAAMPLLRPARKVDLLVMCDASSNIEKEGPKALGALEVRARAEKFSFPTISTDEYWAAAKQPATTFGANETGVPTIVYLPSKLDDTMASYSKTLNFGYSPDQIRALSGVIRAQVKDNRNVIKEAIKAAILKKKASLGR